MRPGDAVWWRYEARGGYGYVFNVPAVLVKVGMDLFNPKAVIDARLKNGGVKRITVSLDKLSPRGDKP